MNFQDLYKKIYNIDKGVIAENETSIEECGDMMPPMSAPKQSDSVTMNVSMNGSGSGGIKDLMNILKNIESGGHEKDMDKLFGEPGELDHQEPIMGDDFANSVQGASDQEVYGIDAVTGTGDDMHSKGIEAPKVNGGGNPMQEELAAKLAELYQSIREGSHQEKTTMKHVKNPTAGEKKAAKDIKAGTAGYRDRVAMLKSAEADGRLKD